MRAKYLQTLVLATYIAVCHSQTLSPVTTTSGLILGHTAPDKPLVAEYLGIPYAQSTRWMPPQRFKSTDLFNASTYVSPHVGFVYYVYERKV